MTVEPYNEDEIDDADTIIRRVSIQQIVWDENSGERRRRISTALYNKSTGLKDGMSVDIEALIINDGVNPREYVRTPAFQGAVSFSAAEIRALELMVGYDPIKDEPEQLDNPYHGEVWRRAEAKRFTSTQQKGLRDVARWYVEIEGVDLK